MQKKLKTSIKCTEINKATKDKSFNLCKKNKRQVKCAEKNKAKNGKSFTY